MAANSELNLIIGVVDKATGPLKGIAGGLEKAGSAALGIGKVVGGLAFGGAVAGVGALSAALVGGIADAREAAGVMAQTEAVIKSTGGAAGFTADQIADMAGALSAAEGKSLFGDSDIQKGQNLLLTFTNIKETLPDATKVMLDMATAMGTDAEGGAIQLGKALNDPVAGISALSRVGVTFTDEQKKVIESLVKTGDVAGAQRIILAELNKEFGGSAEAAAKADGGMAQFRDRMGELAESVGARVLPALNSLLGWLNSPEVQAGITAIVDGLVTGFETVASVVSSVVAAFQEGGLSGVIDLILPKLQEFGSSVLAWIQEQAPIWAAQLLTWGEAFVQWVVDAMPPLMKNLGVFASKMINWVVDQLPGWAAQLKDFAAAAIKWVLDALPGLAVNLGTFAGKLIAWILQTAIDVVPKLAEMALKFTQWVITDVLPKLPGVLAQIWDALVLFLETTATDVVPKLQVIGQAFLDWVQNDVMPFLSEKLDAILTGISDWVTGAAKDVAGYVVSIGTAVVDGIKSGISSAWDGFLGWIDDQIAKIPKTIRDFLGIHSPSTVMIPIGEAIPEGLRVGLEHTLPGFRDSLVGGIAGALAETRQAILDQGPTVLAAIAAMVDAWNQQVGRIQQPGFFTDIRGGYANRSPNWDTSDPGGTYTAPPTNRYPLRYTTPYNSDYTAKTTNNSVSITIHASNRRDAELGVTDALMAAGIV